MAVLPSCQKAYSRIPPAVVSHLNRRKSTGESGLRGARPNRRKELPCTRARTSTDAAPAPANGPAENKTLMSQLLRNAAYRV
jgi:hypothetical protein